MMVVVWMFSALATSACLALAMRAAEEVLRCYRLPLRWLWVAGLMASVGVPAAAWSSGGAWPSGLIAPLETWSVGWWQDAASPGARAAVASDGAAAWAAAWAAPAEWGRPVLVAWLLASLLGLAGYGWAWRRLAMRRRGWRAAEVAGTRVVVSAVDGPHVTGLTRPTVVVPEWLLAEPVEAQRMVLLHETEHVRAGDHALLALAPLVAIALPWNLPLWWQLRRLRLAVELDCDRRVLACGIEALRYGSVLLDVAGRSRSRVTAAAALAEPRTFLERRILAMTKTTTTRRLPRVLAFAALTGVAAALACETAGPLSVNEARPQATRAAGTQIRAGSVAAADFPLVTVDGVVVTRDALTAVDPAEIASIDVVKGAAAVLTEAERRQVGDLRTFSGVIRIRTKAGPSRP